ncbi:MAG: zf-TFIIB domain-containing protein [Spirochaetes bacterium]|nr:zf-TFIIB domain-containing protein [Spirochaetota bacterium]
MKCQVCNGLITPIKTNNIEILQCEKCKGFWVHMGDLNNLIKHQSGDIEFSSIDHHMHKDTHGIMKCYFCEDSGMIKVNFIEYSDIILDYCEICGAFWIDAGELEKMQKYINTIEKNDKKQSLAEIIMNIIYSLPKV